MNKKQKDTHFSKLDDIWPIFRIRIIEKKYANNNTFGRGSSKNYIKNTLLSLFKGSENLWKIKRYKTWIFASSSDLFLSENKLIDNVKSSYIDEISDSLLIIRPHTNIDNKKIWTKRYLYESFLLTVVMMLTKYYKFIKKSIPFENELKEKANNINYKIYYYRFWAEYKIFSKIIKWCKIEQVFLNDSYANFGYIYACKKQKVKVIEVQHGLISKTHKGYMYDTNQNSDLFPDNIFVFGKFFKDILLNYSTLYEKNQIKIVGSNSLDFYSRKKIEKDEQIEKLKQKYNKIVLFSGQFTVDEKSLLLIENIQNQTDRVCFLFLTRKKEEISTYKKDHKNIVFYKGNQKFYDLIKQVDFHATVYSTTFLEALYFGIPNILFDFDNYPMNTYESIINKNYPFILSSNNPRKIIDFINKKQTYSKQKVKECVDSYFNGSFLENLKKAIE